MSPVVHHAPKYGDGATQCCGVPVFELPFDDRMSMHYENVTCPAQKTRLGITDGARR